MPTSLQWFDSHCHLDDCRVDDGAAAALDAARRAGVTGVVTIGTDVARSAAAIAIAGAHDGVWATAGVHPHDARHGIDGIEALLGRPEVVAVGECGLDYHYDFSPRPAQREAFAAQVALAHRHGLALVVHTREAWGDTFDVLTAEGVPPRTVFHCFTAGPDEARCCLDLGAFLSFSGVVSFRNAGDVREAAALCPADRLLVETDAPYLAPIPHRGRPNRLAYLPDVGTALAAARGEPIDDIAYATWRNAHVAFNLPGA